MTSWLAALPIGLACVALVVLPGLLLSYAFGLRSLAAWAMAPVITVAFVAVLGVAAGTAGVGWSVPLVLVATVITAGVIAGGSWLLRHRLRAAPADPREVRLAALAGLGSAVVLGGLTVVLGLHKPDQVSQTFDAVFHYNAVAWILDSRNASSLTMNGLGTVDLPGGFYPAAWHDLTSLLVLATGSTILLSTNMLSAVAAIVVWPLSCLLLARQVFGPARAALAVTGVLSIAFTAFPWGLLGFGVLWPNLLAMTLAPAGMAVVLSLCGLATDDAIGRGRAWLLLPVVAAAETLAQTNVVFSLAVLSLFPVGVALTRRSRRLAGSGQTARAALEPAAAVLLAGLGWWFSATSPALAAVRTQYWPPFESPAQAVGQVLLNATQGPVRTPGFTALWALSIVVVIGIVLCAKRSEHRWLIAGYAISAALYVLSAAINRPDTQKFTGYWYNDAYRLGAMLPIVCVPLAVAGTVHLARRAHGFLLGHRESPGDSPGAGRRRIGALPAFRSAAVPVVLVVLLLGLLTKGLYLGDRVQTLTYRRTDALTGVNGEGWLLDPRARAFFTKIATEIPPGAVVADNPWDGSALLWAVADRKTLFPHVAMISTPEQLYLAAHLIDVGSDPRVCGIARHLHVGYLLIGDGTFWADDGRRREYLGFADPVARPGFQLVDADGPLKLFRLTAC